MSGEMKNGHISALPGSMPFCEQSGEVILGPGVQNEAKMMVSALRKLSFRQKDDLDRAKHYAMDQSIQYVMKQKQVTHQQNQQKASMMSQALSLMARLYVGSCSFELKEENIRSMFSVFGPLKSLNMSIDAVTGNHKGFAFLEFEVPEAALLAKEAMNGKLIGGRNLKVGRPSNMPMALPIIEMITVDAKQYHRIYIASVHPDLTEVDIRAVFEAFGTILKIQLAKHPSGRGHRGFGYLEFNSEIAVKEAIEGMNGFDLGGQYLQVGRCITPPEALMYMTPSSQSTLPTAAAVAAAKISAKVQEKEILNKDKKEPERKALPPPSVRQPPKRKEASPILALPPPGVFDPKKAVKSDSSVPPPPKLVIPQLSIKPEPDQETSSSQPAKKKPRPGFKPIASEEVAPSSSEPVATSSNNKSLPEKRDFLTRIKLKPLPDPMKKASFGPTEKKGAKLDPIFEDDQPFQNGQLAITGSVPSNALAIRENTQLAKVAEKKPTKEKSKSLSLAATGLKRKRKTKIRRERKPKLNSAGALAAVFAAGAINDNMQASKNTDEATLASQEHIEIRGNDARHMLMHKLMRTNRSPVMVLKNMVDFDGVDDELEEEIRSECTNFGTVVDIVIVKEKNLEEVRIFVRFADPTQAENAVNVFDGRYFDGRTVRAQIYDQILFDFEDFTG